MHNLLKKFGFSIVSASTVLVLGSAGAADTGRAGYNVAPVRGAAYTAGQQRMPTMSILPGNATGNTTTNTGTTVPKCPDGGVANSEYTVENCINDVTSCINNGALPGGLNDLFNEDLRNSIFNGMSLCYAQVDKCISDVRRSCKNVYATSSDFWLDYNSRKIQPEYYSFVLRKTGLTPNQAENTCWLLDKNTYGSSFAAIANDGTVSQEYNNKVGAYNNQGGGSLTKDMPQGVTVNTNGTVDAQRGHYARWDAVKGECLVRVAAYNKDSQIKNSWLFGAAGNDQPAEVWKSAGSSFNCGKDMFGFRLMTKTKTTAVVGVGGGTLVGAGVGALAGHGQRNFNCKDKDQVKELDKELRATGKVAVLNQFLDSESQIIVNEYIGDQCEAIVTLYSDYQAAKVALKSCTTGTTNSAINITNTEDIDVTAKDILFDGTTSKAMLDKVSKDNKDREVMNNSLTEDKVKYLTDDGTRSIKITVKKLSNDNTVITSTDKCAMTFSNLNLAKKNGIKPYCSGNNNNCVDSEEFGKQVKELGNVMNQLTILQGEDSNMLAATAIGAGAGAAAGGLATTITAFVEKNNINCRVGDGLQKVDFGKSYSIGSLKDFYVKWNLRLPDTIMPTATATDCTSWKNACATLKDLNQCAAAQLNYKPVNSTNTQLVNTACVVSGSTCVDNHPVAISYGACQ